MRLLVSGAGDVGSVVTGHLLEAGHEVTVIDDLSTGHRDTVLHMAAKSLVEESADRAYCST